MPIAGLPEAIQQGQTTDSTCSQDLASKILAIPAAVGFPKSTSSGSPWAEQVEAHRLCNIRWDINPRDEQIRHLAKRWERDLFDMLNPASLRL